MSTIPLRVAEVEARVHLVRRRLNSFTLQHVAYLAASALVLIAAILIAVGLRAPAAIFRAAVWVSAAAVMVTVGMSVWWATWRWIDVRRAAVLADRGGGLRDRLTTLISLPARPQVSRLLPLLVTQALDLRERWRPESIAPRGVPRSIFMLLASLALLASTAFLERRSIESAAAKTEKGNDFEQRMQMRVPPMPQPGAENRGDVPGEGIDSQSPRLGDSGGLPSTAELQLDGTHDDSAPIQGSAELSEMPDRLQDAIRRAFRAEPMNDMRDLGAKRDEHLSGPNGEGQLNDERYDGTDSSSVPAVGDREGRDEASRQPVQQPKLGAEQRKGNERAGDRRDQGETGPHAGASTGAGEGPAPNPPIGDKADLGDAHGEPTTFKLTITSFLAAVDSRGLPQRDAGTAPARGSAGAAARELSDRQLNDDVLRKTDIPPEYEDVVRRAYSAGK